MPSLKLSLLKYCETKWEGWNSLPFFGNNVYMRQEGDVGIWSNTKDLFLSACFMIFSFQDFWFRIRSWWVFNFFFFFFFSVNNIDESFLDEEKVVKWK